MTIQMITRHCGICGAIIYIEVNVDDQHGIPCGEPDKHAEYHRARGECE